MHLYVHVPFCRRRCSYCDFAIAVRREVPAREYHRVILAEWNHWAEHPIWQQGRRVESIYFGGGTPSLLPADVLADLLGALIRGVQPAGDCEITLEANPDDVTPSAVAGWRAAGVNRVSLGGQSFSDDALRWMHRTHDSDRIAQACTTLRLGGVNNVSLDLIFGLPQAIERNWLTDLDRAVALEPDHISLYGLTVEPHTPLARWISRGTVMPPAEGHGADEYLAAHERLGAAGYRWYEVSNAALPGRRSRHNSAYWSKSSYLGLGPSAHSSWGRTRQWNRREWRDYRDAVAGGADPVAGREILTDEQEHIEQLYLGLRTSDGLDPAQVPPEVISRWLSAGWATAEGRLRLTAEGWLRLDALVAEVLKTGPAQPEPEPSRGG